MRRESRLVVVLSIDLLQEFLTCKISHYQPKIPIKLTLKEGNEHGECLVQLCLGSGGEFLEFPDGVLSLFLQLLGGNFFSSNIASLDLLGSGDDLNLSYIKGSVGILYLLGELFSRFVL